VNVHTIILKLDTWKSFAQSIGKMSVLRSWLVKRKLVH